MKKCQPRLLTPYHDGELTREARGEVEEHLQSCPSCGAMLDEVVVASSKVRSMGRATVPLEALVPAVEVFAERAGLELGAPSLSDTVEVAREPAGVVAPVPPVPVAAETEVDLEPEVAESHSPDLEPGSMPFAPAPAVDPPLAPLPPPTSRPTTAAAPGIGLADDGEPVSLAPPVMPGIEPMAPPPTANSEAAGGEDTEDGEEIEEADEPQMAVDVEAEPQSSEEPEQMELAAPAEPVGFHTDAPPHELRPPWMGEADVEEQSLEAEGRAAVDDAIERDTAADDDGTVEDSQATEATSGGEELETTPEIAETDVPAMEADDAEDAERELTPLEPIPDLGTPGPRPEPRLEPPPEPWTTVWRPNRGVEPELPAAQPEPPAEIEPAAAAMRFEIKDEPAPQLEHPALETEHDVEPTAGLKTHGTGPDQPLPEVEEAIARLRGDLREGTAEPGLLLSDEEPVESFESLSDYQTALQQRREKRRPAILGIDLRRPANQLKVGAAAAVLLLLVLAGTALALTRQSRPSTATQTQPPTQASSAPQTQATAPATAGNPAAVPANKVPQLTGPVTSGAGGTGYAATKIRAGSPGNGITRLVLDLTGSGATPSAQLGRGPDGAAYLVASGISVDPSVLAAFKGSGLVTGVSQLDGTGLNLKLTLNGSPQYAMIYLSSPTRLVIDFK